MRKRLRRSSVALLLRPLENCPDVGTAVRDRKADGLIAHEVMHEILQHSELLLTRRARGISHALNWCLPGGRADQGETEFETVCREVREEVGIDLRDEAQYALLGRMQDFAAGPASIVKPFIFLYIGQDAPDSKPCDHGVATQGAADSGSSSVAVGVPFGTQAPRLMLSKDEVESARWVPVWSTFHCDLRRIALARSESGVSMSLRRSRCCMALSTMCGVAQWLVFAVRFDRPGVDPAPEVRTAPLCAMCGCGNFRYMSDIDLAVHNLTAQIVVSMVDDACGLRSSRRFFRATFPTLCGNAFSCPCISFLSRSCCMHLSSHAAVRELQLPVTVCCCYMDAEQSGCGFPCGICHGRENAGKNKVVAAQPQAVNSLDY